MFECYPINESFEDILIRQEIPLLNNPVWILGKKYETENEREELYSDIRSKIWFTYRKNFPQIGSSGPTTDKGWGCMLRCGQMLLCQALIYFHLSREWKWTENTFDEIYLNILNMFADDEMAIYSIHQIALMGSLEGKKVGQWYGPNMIIQMLKKLSEKYQKDDLIIHVAMDNLIVIGEIKSQCQQLATWKPLILAIPLRIGLNKINPVYLPSLKMCLTVPQSLGIIGGRPNHALYILGFLENDAIFLDPHYTQNIANVRRKLSSAEIIADSTYHCDCPFRLDFLAMDPSIAVCFGCKTEVEFDNLCSWLQNLVKDNNNPLFEICQEVPQFWLKEDKLQTDVNTNTLESWSYSTDEEFEIL